MRVFFHHVNGTIFKLPRDKFDTKIRNIVSRIKAGRKIVVNKRIFRERLKPSSSLVLTLMMETMTAALDRRLDPRGKVASNPSLNIKILDI